MKRIATLIALIAGLASTAPLAMADQPGQPPAPSPVAKPTLVPPSAAQLETLAIELSDVAMHVFVEGVRGRDLRGLGQIASLKFRKSYTPEQVNAAFKQFFATTVVGDPLAGKSPIFLKAPEINRGGALEVQGFYELPEGLLLFQLAYVREGTGWKLDGINVRSQPYNAPSANPASSEKPLKFKIPAGKMVDA
jgi:hypothetical protein